MRKVGIDFTGTTSSKLRSLGCEWSTSSALYFNFQELSYNCRSTMASMCHCATSFAPCLVPPPGSLSATYLMWDPSQANAPLQFALQWDLANDSKCSECNVNQFSRSHLIETLDSVLKHVGRKWQSIVVDSIWCLQTSSRHILSALHLSRDPCTDAILSAWEWAVNTGSAH